MFINMPVSINCAIVPGISYYLDQLSRGKFIKAICENFANNKLNVKR